MTYGPYWSPAVVLLALLTLALAPYLSLLVLVAALLGTAAAVVAGTARAIALAPVFVHRAVRSPARVPAGAGQASAVPSAAGAVVHDEELIPSCS